MALSIAGACLTTIIMSTRTSVGKRCTVNDTWMLLADSFCDGYIPRELHNIFESWFVYARLHSSE